MAKLQKFKMTEQPGGSVKEWLQTNQTTDDKCSVTHQWKKDYFKNAIESIGYPFRKKKTQ